jgi:hypothetical protein
MANFPISFDCVSQNCRPVSLGFEGFSKLIWHPWMSNGSTSTPNSGTSGLTSEEAQGQRTTNPIEEGIPQSGDDRCGNPPDCQRVVPGLVPGASWLSQTARASGLMETVATRSMHAANRATTTYEASVVIAMDLGEDGCTPKSQHIWTAVRKMTKAQNT